MKLKHWVKQNNTVIGQGPTDDSQPTPNVSDISVQRLIDQSLIALDREVRNLLTLSARGKLSPPDARDLRDHLKLLFELKDREASSLAGITDEELKALAKKYAEQDDDK